jgi:hypothetical protein
VVPGIGAVVEIVKDEVTGVPFGITGLVEKAHSVAVGTVDPTHFSETPLGNPALAGTGETVAV